MNHKILVIGGSAGSVDAVLHLASRLPVGFPAAVFIVIHISGTSKGELADSIRIAGPLDCALAKNGEPILPGRIYLARPDHHLLVEAGKVIVDRGPKENFTRPAIDPLFRSAAAAYGPRVIGIILSGLLDDGAQGLARIKSAGGLAVVQDPRDALFPGMPRNACLTVKPDYVLPLSEIPALLARLAWEPASALLGEDGPHLKEAMIKSNHLLTEETMNELGKPSVFTCPDCGGALFEIKDSGLNRYRCSIGHAYGAHSLMAGKGSSIEEALSAALRAMQESERLSRRMMANLSGEDFSIVKSELKEKAESMTRHARILQSLIAEIGSTAGYPPTEP